MTRRFDRDREYRRRYHAAWPEDSPDLDIVTYTLAGLWMSQGLGYREETFNALRRLASFVALAGSTWATRTCDAYPSHGDAGG